MASAERHKQRSGRSYRNNMSQFAGFARKVMVRNDHVKQTKSIREALTKMFKRNKGDA